MTELSNLDVQKLEEYWMKYGKYKNQLQFAKENNLPVEKEEQHYRTLQNIVSAIEKVYNQSNEDARTLINMRYWDKDNTFYDWEEIADKLFISRSKTLRKRKLILHETAKYMGWI